MDPRSQVLLRQAELFDGSILLAGAPADALLAELPHAQAWSWLADDYQQLARNFPERVHTGIVPPKLAYTSAVLFLPKSRELAAYLMQALASQINGGTLFLVGEKRSGIEGAAKQLAQLGQTYKVDSARHSQLWQCHIEQAPPQPNPEDGQQTFNCAGLTIHSLPGVFSHGRLDKGTALLLEHLEGLPAGHWLDFGCGAGVVGTYLKQHYPKAQLTLFDVDAFAVRSSELSLAANQLEAGVVFGAGIEDAPHELSAIITNPPFHQGVHTNYQATEQLIQQAAAHLRPGGELRLVANSFLKYQPLIEAHLGPCKLLAERNGFRVYSARRAK